MIFTIGLSVYFFALSAAHNITVAAPSVTGEQSRRPSGHATGAAFIACSSVISR